MRNATQPGRAMHVRTGNRSARAAVDDWLARFGVDAVRFDDVYSACAWLTRAGMSAVGDPSASGQSRAVQPDGGGDGVLPASQARDASDARPPLLAVVGAHWLSGGELGILGFLRRTWPDVPLLIYGDPAEWDGAGRLPATIICRTLDQLRTLLETRSPDSLAASLSGRAERRGDEREVPVRRPREVEIDDPTDRRVPPDRALSPDRSTAGSTTAHPARHDPAKEPLPTWRSAARVDPRGAATSLAAESTVASVAATAVAATAVLRGAEPPPRDDLRIGDPAAALKRKLLELDAAVAIAAPSQPDRLHEEPASSDSDESLESPVVARGDAREEALSRRREPTLTLERAEPSTLTLTRDEPLTLTREELAALLGDD